MKRNLVRVVILAGLIIACIGQMLSLWLGNVPSHHFFMDQKKEIQLDYNIWPSQIWVMNGYAYKIAGMNTMNSNRYLLIQELMTEVRKEIQHLEEDIKLSYEQLLSSQGIIYEYSTPLTLQELIGKNVELKGQASQIQKLFIQVDGMDGYKTSVYFIDEEDEVRYLLNLKNSLIVHQHLFDYYTHLEQTQMQQLMNYQASLLAINDKDKFSKNTFYPLVSQHTPFYYQSLMFKAIDLKDEQINDLFTNPIYKQTKSTTSGSLYTDNLNLSVQFDKKGTLSFKRSIADDISRTNDFRTLASVLQFVENTAAIPESLKQGLYLKKVVEHPTGEKDYVLGFQYHNQEVVLSEKMKMELEVENFVVITTKKGHLIGGKWLMMEPVGGQMQSFQKSTNEAMLYRSPDSISLGITGMDCGYILDEVGKETTFKWLLTEKLQ